MTHETSASPNAAPTSVRWCFHVDETMQIPGGYRPAVNAEVEPGDVPSATRSAVGSGGPSIEQAKATARELNTALGLTEDDVAAIVASPMTA